MNSEKLVEIKLSKDNMIVITYQTDIDAFLSFFPDTKYLMDNASRQNGNSIYLTEETFSYFLEIKRTIPLLLTIESEENIRRVEYAFNYVLSILQKELDEIRKDIEKEYIPHKIVDVERMQKLAEKLIQQAYRNELTRKVALDLKEYEEKHPEGIFYDNGFVGGC